MRQLRDLIGGDAKLHALNNFFFITGSLLVANIFLKIDSKITGLRFLTGPLGFPGLGSGISWPRVSSVGFFPVSAM